MTDRKTPIALTIAGSDSGGGAGVQADIKTFCAFGVYAASVVTALTAQNTRGVSGIHNIPTSFVSAQIDTVFDDLAVDAVKIGMLSTAEIVTTVATGLDRWRPTAIVLDPVMVAASGDKLLADDAIAALRDELLPHATVLTPNLLEAAALLDARPAESRDERMAQAQALLALGAPAIVLKGGHGASETSDDLLLTRDMHLWLPGVRHRTRNTHGTGCTFAAALAAGLAKKQPLADAAQAAKRYIAGAIAAADQLNIGHGHGPVHHFHALWSDA